MEIKNDKNVRKKRNIIDYMALFVVVCIIAIILLSSYVLAKYATGGGGVGVTNIDYYSVSTTLKDGSGAEVQQFNITVSETGKSCSLDIANNGSISVNYTVTLTNETKNLPLYLTLNSTTDNAVNNYVSVSGSLNSTSSNTATVSIYIAIEPGTEYNNLYREIDRVSVKIEFIQAETTS